MKSPIPLKGDILIVDDRLESLRLSMGILQQVGHRVRPVLGGMAAQNAILAERPEVVITDLSIASVGGLELCRWIKQRHEAAPIPVIVVSGEMDSARKSEAFSAGARDFLSRPFEAEDLLLRVELHLRLHRQQQELAAHINLKHAAVEERLRVSSAELSKLYAAVEQSPASVVITDAQGRIEYVNRTFTEVTGYSPEEAHGQNPRILKSGDTQQETYKELWETITKGQVWRGIFRNRRKDGGHIWESVSIAPVRASEGTTITHFIAVKEDITTQREVEAQLHQAQKMEAIGQLAAGIAHEINTPTQFVSDNLFFLQGAFGDLLGLMASYRRMADLVAAEPSHTALVSEIRKAEVAADIAYVVDNAPTAFESSLDGIKRISKIVRAMKEFSHPDQREMAPANLNAALENTLTIARNEYKYVADVEKEFAELPPVVCHVGDLCQVFLNLLVNASHAIDDVMRRTGARGIIKIRTIAETLHARIEIEDSGTGIPESARPHIFDPFFTTKEVGKGTGQGLAIAHGIVVGRHKGTLSFQTEMGKGTTFILRLPYVETISPITGELPAISDEADRPPRPRETGG